MGTTDKLIELIKSLPDREAGEVLDFAEFLQARRERERAEARETLERHRERYDGQKWIRDELHDRSNIR